MKISDLFAKVLKFLKNYALNHLVPIILKYENGITEITFDNSKKLLDYAEYLLEHL